jgi:hypothetical protein
MKRQRILIPNNLTPKDFSGDGFRDFGLDFYELYEDISRGWKDKAEKLQIRRWRKIKHQVEQ